MASYGFAVCQLAPKQKHTYTSASHTCTKYEKASDEILIPRMDWSERLFLSSR